MSKNSVMFFFQTFHKKINDDFYRQLNLIGPYGISNPIPIFWTRKCRIIEINPFLNKE